MSIINQTYKDLQIILIDDGSDDDSLNICKKFQDKDERIVVVHKERNGGLGAARNTGLDLVTGDYISFVDSDDWLIEDAYEYFVYLIEESGADIISGEILITYKNKSHCYIKESKNYSCFDTLQALKFYLESGISKRNSDFSVCNKIYRRELFNKIRFPVGQYYEDMVTNFKLIAASKKFIKSKKIVYFYYQDRNSITRNKLSIKDLALLKVGDELIDLVALQEDTNLLKLAKVIKARGYFSLLVKGNLYGSENNINFSEESREWRKEIRNSFLLLCKSKLPINRKLILSLLCIGNWPLKPITIVYKRVIKNENKTK